jgi:hypothetical protein
MRTAITSADVLRHSLATGAKPSPAALGVHARETPRIDDPDD